MTEAVHFDGATAPRVVALAHPPRGLRRARPPGA